MENPRDNSVDNLFEDPNIPIEYAFMSARKYPVLAPIILKQIFHRANEESEIEMIKKNEAYKDMVEGIINDDNIEDKIHLVLYYEPGLILQLFGSMSSLIDKIEQVPTMYDETLKKINNLMKASDYNYNKDIEDKIVAALSRSIDLYNKEMKELIRDYIPEMYNQIKNDEDFDEKREILKQAMIEEVRNKGKRVLN